MGVTGLWSVVAPTARPTSLASLNRKRLAVDASIWIYQFLKAVRDKEGNALRNSHVVGFFRRICKLLYFGIKPVFVFDGGAPTLKRETVRKRRQRREGRREDAVRTAGRLLAVQMERVVEEERERARKEKEGGRRAQDEEEGVGEEAELVYVDEIGMGEAERKKGRAEGFKRRDQYHLPDLDVRIEDMGAPNDPRIMSQTELEEYAQQFHSGEDINLYDFSKIDFESPFFLSLPAGDRYNILNAARLRSRLRMGYTKDQLNGMFPDRMAFSRFQIERVRERNELTQRLMHINGMGDEWDSGGRIAGEKGKEYVLVRNDGVEGGWALGVVSNKLGTSKGMAIDVDEDSDADGVKSENDDSDEFEDVEIEGLNRLPQSWKRKRAREVDYDISYEDAAEKIAKKRKAVYDARKAAVQAPVSKPVQINAANGEQDGLFVEQDGADEDDDLFEDVDIGPPPQDEDDDLQRAIAMSLEQPQEQQESIERPEENPDKDQDDAFDMRAALAEARQSKHESKTKVRPGSPKPPSQAPKFDGPLPFESLNLGQSLLGKKKAKKVEEDLSGGFQPELGDDTFRKERPPQPVPSWFDAAPTTKDMKKIRVTDGDEDGEDYVTSGPLDASREEILQRKPTNEVIDLEAEPSTQQPSQVELSSDDEDFEQVTQEAPAEPNEWQLPEHEQEQVDAQAELRRKAEEEAREARYAMAREIAAEPEGAEQPTMDEVADRAQEKPPSPTEHPMFIPSPKQPEVAPQLEPEDEEMFEWSASEAGSPARKLSSPAAKPAAAEAEDSDEEFEDVPMNDLPPPALLHQPSTNEPQAPTLDASEYLLPAEDEPAPRTDANAQPEEYDDQFSDSDEELMRQLAIEAEEHARFTNSLNSSNPYGTKDAASAARDYENELKQLRSQQKRDRRDADEVTQTMIQECQALLGLFGLPYITAPMEAEAQCAELVSLGLVDGIITDDSDIFLFGGTRVYKNMFSQNKFVECYLLSDLEREYTLTRHKLIAFAHLLGSDYTTGLTGIGPVTALEILTDFSGDLSAFRDWCDQIQKAAHHQQPRGSGSSDLDGLLNTSFRRKFKSAAQKRVLLPTGFPDARVDHAYLQPDVDADPHPFEWGVPDLDKLRGFLMATIGWSQERTDEVLVPVIRDMNRRGVEGTQANITRFFSGGVGVGAASAAAGGAAAGAAAKVGSGRAAVEGGAGDEALGQRNRTGKESGRMRNAWKRLRGEAERQRRGGDEVVAIESGVPEAVEEGAKDVDVEAQVLGGEDDGDRKAKNKAKSKARKGSKVGRAGTRSPSLDEDADSVADDEAYGPKQKQKRKQAANKDKRHRRRA
ncbi:uncharacterized protein HMPREF1541_06552 [Cyphellophora europaea CBS 101466]|uniref:PIN domain-like protein n=1 Tax=Cyphellophora europaea (strain CBS 101466) TaxID=1220924 RepID=W2RPX4_CYPE1|nr:uncharacterized protein HMPREF1541_06552 [Cyphellophora europaea CBS 101466]ETN38517.1 hypothetical protein HMPREF1541_06552 [Cyphellophora europaea CBS 101466]